MNITLLALVLTALPTTAFAENFVVHEWGTFTSFQDASGSSLYGLQRGDEPLPSFVYLRNPTSSEPSHTTNGCRRNSYSCDWQPITEPVGNHKMGVTQRMETPVIYFHSEEARNVNVKVDFPQGIITEWFPGATSFAPEIGQVRDISSGTMTWDVNVHARGEHVPLPAIPSGSIWGPSRNVDANDLTIKGENERLIFYRGVGDFSTGFHVNVEPTQFKLSNSDPSEEVPTVIYIHVTKEGGIARDLNPIAGGATVGVPYSESTLLPLMPKEEYIENASLLMEKVLANAGLYRDEARALVGTWRHAYFETLGERFLYILPSKWTDNLLPMTLTPAPFRLERALVGRVEVVNHLASGQLYQKIFDEAQSGPVFTAGMGPFAEQLLNLVLARNYAAMDSAVQGVPEENRGPIRAPFLKAESAISEAIQKLQ